MARDASENRGRRKIIAFDDGTWQALDLLARDRGRSLQELADEAFADLLRKYHRPVTLAEALKASMRQLPANEPEPPSGKRRKGR